jgi:hypothetical protein
MIWGLANGRPQRDWTLMKAGPGARKAASALSTEMGFQGGRSGVWTLN